jgi:hypothetical protein
MCRMFNVGQSVTPQIILMEEFTYKTMDKMAQWLWTYYATIQWLATCRNAEQFVCQPNCWYYEKRYWNFKCGFEFSVQISTKLRQYIQKPRWSWKWSCHNTSKLGNHSNISKLYFQVSIISRELIWKFTFIYTYTFKTITTLMWILSQAIWLIRYHYIYIA